MKTLISALIVTMSIAAAPAVLAEEGKQCAKHEKVLQKLNLSEEREAEVKAVMETFKDRKKVIREETKTQMKALMDEQKTALEGLLSEEEMAILGEEMHKRGKKAKHKKFLERMDG